MFDLKKNNILINKDINKKLENIIKNKVFSNGYIFYGPEGIGKKQTAINFTVEIFKQFSSDLNIKEKILDNNHPDFLLIEPTLFVKGNLKNRSEVESPKNNKEIIRIEQIRKIKIFLSQKSIESGKKVVLLSDAHLLNEAASNCLLKTLEEPTNGIFILLTPKINLILDTIISRCQLMRFQSFSHKQLDNFIRNNLDSANLNTSEKLNLQYLINSADGSPGKIMKYIIFWKELSDEIKENLDFPMNNKLDILRIAKLISDELNIDQQIFLINFIQNKWWILTKNESIIKKLESLKRYLRNFIQPRLAWEVILLKIAINDL